MGYDFDTSAVHAGREDFLELGVHTAPLDLSSTYPIPDLEEGTASLEALAHGAADAPQKIYSRLNQPTVARFEGALAKLEGAEHAVAYASGMAALTAVLLALRVRHPEDARPHVLALRPIYGGSDHLLDHGLTGCEVEWVQANEIARKVRPETRLIIAETPANPTLKWLDLEQLVADAQGTPVLVDSTFATPVLQTPIAHGVTLVLHSATKFLGGHGDVLAGIVATSDEEWAAALRHVRVITGACMHPMAAYLCLRSLPTLPLRVRRATETATELADFLAEQPAVSAVHYPKADHPLLGSQMLGRGSLISFELAGGYEAAAAVMKAVKLCVPAVSLGSTDTLIQHPAGLTHHVVPEEQRVAAGITAGMIRLSVGLESFEDLRRDLSQALALAATTAPAAAPEQPSAAAPQAPNSRVES
ncbi:MAG: cystathionine gamma-synthase [Planctomycetes bacterium]|nr:cystathionine gamma-synthase [Planctomycetota bacterium]